MGVPYTFGTATTSIPLSNLDANFNTPVTIGSTTVGLGNTVTTVANLTLTNATISSGNVTVTTGIFGAGSNTAPSITTTGDTNTGIFFPTADTIAFTEGGVESMRIDSSGQVGIGTSSPNGKVDIVSSSAGANTDTLFLTNSSGNAGTATSLVFGVGSDPTNRQAVIRGINAGGNAINLAFLTSNADAPAERMRIDSSGNLLVGSTSADLSNNNFISKQSLDTTAGIAVINNNTGSSASAVMRYKNSGSAIAYAGLGGTNRAAYAGLGANILAMYTDNAAGMGFLVDAAGPITFNTNALERMRIDASGNLLVGKTAPTPATVGCEMRGNGVMTCTRSAGPPLTVNRTTDDGDLVAFSQDGAQEGSISVSGSTVSYNGGHLSRWSQLPDGSKDDTILKGTVLTNLDDMCVWEKDGVVAENEQLNKMKVSDVEGDTNVAGVFVNWTIDEQYGVDDMNVAMTGDMIIRIAEGVVVQKGDLLMSAGDGTAKPQGDDIRRSKTVAKVTSNHVTCTYADGSYCVPCVLMAC